MRAAPEAAVSEDVDGPIAMSCFASDDVRRGLAAVAHHNSLFSPSRRHMEEGSFLLLEELSGELIRPLIELMAQGHLGLVEPRDEDLIEFQTFNAVHGGQAQGGVAGVIGFVGIDHPRGEAFSLQDCVEFVHRFIGAGGDAGGGEAGLLRLDLAEGVRTVAVQMEAKG